MNYNVLVFPGATEIGLEIRRSLEAEKTISVFGASGEPFDAGNFLYSTYDSAVPFISDPKFLAYFSKLIDRWQIDFIVPAYDDVGLYLSTVRESLKCTLCLPPHDTVEILRSKKATLSCLQSNIPVPLVYSYEEALDQVRSGTPIFAKPDRGQGSQGAQKIDTLLELEKSRLKLEQVFTEYLPGAEYTIDCISSASGELLGAFPRIRQRAKGGIAVYTEPFESALMQSYARIISSKLKLIGAWFFQMKCDERGAPKLLEVAPRIAGSMALTRARGVNMPLLTIFAHAGIDFKVTPSACPHLSLGRSLATHFRSNINFETVYLDLDDTLLFRGRLQAKVIMFAFQCLCRGKKVVLLTKHSDDNLAEKLKAMRIYQLFDEIIHIGRHEKKSEYIESDSSPILIDDSFSERLEVAEALGIPTFDVSSLDCLIDERV